MVTQHHVRPSADNNVKLLCNLTYFNPLIPYRPTINRPMQAVRITDDGRLENANCAHRLEKTPDFRILFMQSHCRTGSHDHQNIFFVCLSYPIPLPPTHFPYPFYIHLTRLNATQNSATEKLCFSFVSPTPFRYLCTHNQYL